MLVHESHDQRALADGGRAALDGSGAHVAGRVNAGHARLEQPVGPGVLAGQHEAALVPSHDVAEPFGARVGSEEEEQEGEGDPLAVAERDGLELAVAAVQLRHLAAPAHRETMSEYLVLELERYGIAVRDRSEIVELHGSDGELEAVTLRDGVRLPLSFLFLFLGASPCTEWLGETVKRDDHGFVLTGAPAGAEGLLETSVPGIYAAGDVRSGSIKRCATAVGEGAMVVSLVHTHRARTAA